MKQAPKKVPKSVFKGAPFLHIVIPFIAGILVYEDIKIQLSFKLLLWIVVFLFIANILLLIYRKRMLRRSIVSKIFLGLLIACSGIFMSWENDITNNPYFIGKQPTDSIGIWKGIITQPPTEKANTFLVSIKIQAIKIGNRIEPATGEIVAYIKKENVDTRLQRGQTIYANSALNIIKNLGNPGEFNYQQYVNRKNIYYQTYITNNFAKGEYIAPFFVIRYIEKVQQYVLKTLDKYLAQKSVNGVAKALIIGYRQDLDPEVYQEYVNMGVVHVIAISGLHVGIISYIIGLFLWALYQHKKTKLTAFFIHLIILWGFCFLAGATPSILRACLCFSILEMGKHFFRPIRNPFQSLALSAFIILCISPMSIFQLGFILSYGALMGLFLAARYIQNWMNAESWFFKKITEILSATLAAQIFVIPITLLLFHQFSMYFIISNLLIVPLSSVALMSVIFLLLVGWFSFVAVLVAWLVTIGISTMNFIVHQASTLPYSLFTDIPITIIQTLLLYIVAMLIVLWIQRGKRKFGMYIAAIFILYFTIQWIDNIQRDKQQFLIVLNTPKQTNIAHIDGEKTIVYTSTTDTTQLYKKYIHNLSYHYNSTQIQYHFLDTLNTFIAIKNKTFHIINHHFLDTFPISNTHYFIFSNTYHKLYDMKKDSFSMYIVSHSKMEQSLSPYKTNIFNTSQKGAWAENINSR